MVPEKTCFKLTMMLYGKNTSGYDQANLDSVIHALADIKQIQLGGGQNKDWGLLHWNISKVETLSLSALSLIHI